MLYLLGYFFGKQRIVVRINKMKHSIPILIFLKSLGLTQQKIMLAINDSTVFKNLIQDELKTFEKYEDKCGKNFPKTIEGNFELLGEILTEKTQNIMRK